MENTATELRGWLVERVADYVELPAEQIRHDVELSEYGLDSVSALTVCTDIEDRFGVSIEPTALWDHPTIDTFAEFVSGHLPPRA
ncbi:polyketide synthase [Amycolatopsis antarctica]|uniref:Polyketide synthase n=1 Tax=Amycolatopsis antarctica TaxID=1854586 RepID=A0A263D637_9PSEU|nr:acyl carrier protein [Amycolatopsis antarctica]OZM72936.1 polyketide synthase [Amycolatopsis antarctica]